jgi:hypothetical protein
MKGFARMLLVGIFALFAGSVFAAETYKAADFAALLKELPKAKVSLADGVKQLSKAHETAISGKFELEDGKLSLSIYTAAKGLAVDAEHNVLKEYAGSPEKAPWKPEGETFKDAEHVDRSSTQLTLMSKSKLSLGEIIQQAGKDQKGTVFSVNPQAAGGKQIVEVLVADQGKVTVLRYDLPAGKLIDKATL